MFVLASGAVGKVMLGGNRRGPGQRGGRWKGRILRRGRFWSCSIGLTAWDVIRLATGGSDGCTLLTQKLPKRQYLVSTALAPPLLRLHPH